MLLLTLHISRPRRRRRDKVFLETQVARTRTLQTSIATTLLSLSFVCICAHADAQAIKFTDPANLRGERTVPRDGREPPIDRGARGLQQLFRKLRTRASLMLIVAHPDDEDGGMLTLYSRGLGARVAMLTLNRGEGGQNAVSADFEDALGLLRTEELLSADRYLGVDQMFGTEIDFGFSKTKEESFARWTHERVLFDAVRAVRLYRPLVIASVFIGEATDGHGHHQVAGEIAQEVFKAAGDPKVFPELTAQGILPWQPLKVYARVPLAALTDHGLFDYATSQFVPASFINYVTGEVTTSLPSNDVVVHEAQTDPLLSDSSAKSETYASFAREGLGLQKSQIDPGVRQPGLGPVDVAYHRYASLLKTGIQSGPEETFFDGIDTTLAGIAELAPGAPPAWKTTLTEITNQIDAGSRLFDPTHLERSLPFLRDALRSLDALLMTVEHSAVTLDAKANVLHELRIKRTQLNDALFLVHGIEVATEAVHPELQDHGRFLSTNTNLSIDLGVTNKGETRISFLGGRLRLVPGTPAYQITPFQRFPAASLAPTESAGISLSAMLPQGLPATRPYFSRPDTDQPFYDLTAPELRNAPLTPWPMVAELNFEDEGLPLLLPVVVTDQPAQIPFQPVEVVPPVSVGFPLRAQIFARQDNELFVAVTSRPYNTQDQLAVQVPDGWKATLGPGDRQQAGMVRFRIEPTATATLANLRALNTLPDGAVYSEQFQPVGYGELPLLNYYAPATERVVPIDLKLPTRRRIGYLPGTGDTVPEALASMGLQPSILTVADLTPDKLSQFDTVVLGVRTYDAHPELHGAATQALMSFVQAGGNVVLQYQTAEFTEADSPLPLHLGRDAEKVVDEKAAVQFLDPTAPVLHVPNQLSESDFRDWIEERGHGFLRYWDVRYNAPTEVHDPGSASEGVKPQVPQKGGLVTARIGKGHWTYCAFALYRQLPEGVPGAYRMMANLLALADEE